MKTLIWDLDGTLVDSYERITSVTKEVFAPYKDFSIEEIHNRVIKTSVVDFFMIESENLDLNVEDLFTHYQSLTSKIEPRDYKLMEQTKEILSYYLEHGYKHYIYTHRGSSTYNILESHDIRDWFEDIVTSEDGFNRKPDPDALNHLITKYKLDISETYYIGDRLLDVLCGKAAGVGTVYIGDDSTIEADISIESINDIKQYISI